MREQFKRTATTVLSVSEVEALLHDVAVLASCSNYIGDVSTIDPQLTWETSLVSKVGPFRLTAPIRVHIEDEQHGPQDGTYSLAISAEGQDRGLGTRLLVKASITYDSAEPSTLTMDGIYDVTGRVAALGGSVVKQQAQIMIDDFWGRLSEYLAGGVGDQGENT